MPLLNITESKKLTVITTLEEGTARAVEQYAAWRGGTPDEVIQQALDYVFVRDKEFERYRSANPNARPKVALRVKRSAAAAGAKDGGGRGKATAASHAREEHADAAQHRRHREAGEQ